MIPRIPRWQSYVAQTTQPMFTPKQCQMIIDAGHSVHPNKPKLVVVKKVNMILRKESQQYLGYLLPKCQRCIKQ